MFRKVAELTPYFWILVPVVALAVNVAAQILFFRATRGTHFMRSIIGGCLAGLGALAVLSVVKVSVVGLSFSELANGLLVDAPVYFALSYCYYNFVQLGQTSVRIRLYTEIAARPAGMASGDIARLYNEEALMQLRVERLVESGDIVQRGGRYFVGRRRLVWVARIIFAGKRLLLGRESEFGLPGEKS